MVDDLNVPTSLKTKLKQTLNKFPVPFGGGLGKLKIKPVSIELKEGAKPNAARFCSVLKAVEAALRKEID